MVLAAGQGTRMGPDVDKALVDIGGIPMLKHVLRNCAEIPRRQLVIVRGPGQDALEFPGHDFEIAIQDAWQPRHRRGPYRGHRAP